MPTTPTEYTPIAPPTVIGSYDTPTFESITAATTNLSVPAAPAITPATPVSTPDVTLPSAVVPTRTFTVGGIVIADPDAPGSMPGLTSIILPTTPTVANITPPGDAPTLSFGAAPVAPMIDLPTPPTLSVIAPASLSYTLPTFTSVAPTDTTPDFSATFDFNEGNYSSATWDALTAKVLGEVTTPTSGIDSTVESALWGRGRSRESTAVNAATVDTGRQVTVMGGRVPPGAKAAMIASAANEASLAVASLGREVQLQRSQLKVANRLFMGEQSIGVEVLERKMFEDVAERALDKARALATYAVSLFSSNLARYNAQVERFKILVGVYETRIRAAGLALQVYRSELEATGLSLELKQLYAELYTVQLQGVRAYAEVYRSQLSAAAAAMEVDRIKLEAFKSSVDIYEAQLGAKEIEAKLYEAGVRGETSKIKVYESQLQGYQSQVEAYKITVDSAKTVAQTRISVKEVELAAYKADLARYEIELKGYQARWKALSGKFSADTAQYEASSHAEVQVAMARAEINKAAADIALRAGSIYREYALDLGKIAVDQAQITSHEAIEKARINNTESMTGAQIAGSEKLAIAQNQFDERMSKLQVDTGASIERNHMETYRLNTLSTLATSWRAALVQIYSTESASVANIRAQWDSAYVHSQIAIAKAFANRRLGVVNITTKS